MTAVKTLKVLPSREKAADILELLGKHWTDHDIVDKVWGERLPECTTVVRQMRRDPHLFDVDVDEVAVARALAGDAAVWEALTHYERREVMLAIYARREEERDENYADKAAFHQHRGQFNYIAPCPRDPEWLCNIADAIGRTPGSLTEQAREHALARVL